MAMRVDVHDIGFHHLKMILTARASTFTFLLLGTLLTGGLSIGEAASGTSHDRSDLEELLEKLQTSIASLSSRSAAATCSGNACAADAGGRSAVPSSATLASSDANRRDEDGAPLPSEKGRTSQALDARKSPLVVRLKLIEQLLRQQQQQQQRERDYQPQMTDETTEVVQARGFDRHGRLFGEIPMASAVRRTDQDGPAAGRDQLEGLSAAGDSRGRNGELKAGEHEGSRVLSLLAKLLQQQQLKSSGQQQPQEFPQPSRDAAAAADDAPVPPSSSLRSSDSKPPQQELTTASPSQPSPLQQSDQQHDLRQQTLTDAVMQLISVVQDLAEDEQRLRAENEEMLDTVVSIAALEARHRLADDKRTQLEAAMEA